MATPTQTLSDIRLAMASTNSIFNAEVFGQLNFEALDEVYTANARILPPGAPMIAGRPAIKEFWANVIQSMKAKSAILESVEVMEAGDGIVEIGRAVLTMESEAGSTAEAEVKYVVYWRQEDGRWKWDVDIWNMNA